VAREEARVVTERELVAAIAAAPDDDAPKLVYADWLIERGDARGEHVRLAIAGHEPAAKALRDAHPEWTAGLPARLTFARGFVVGATLDDERRDWPALLERHPLLRDVQGSTYAIAAFPPGWLRRAWIIDWPGSADLAALPFGGLEELGILGGMASGQDLASLDLPALRSFVIGSGYFLGEDAIEAIAAARWFPQLERLVLKGRMTTEVARAVAARAPALRDLELVNVWPAEPATLETLIALPGLERLAVNALWDGLRDRILANPTIRSIAVFGGELTDETARLLAARGLERLELGKCTVTVPQARVLRAAGHAVEPRYELGSQPPGEVDGLRERYERAMRPWGEIPILSIDTLSFPHDAFALLAAAVASVSGERLSGENWIGIGQAVWAEIADRPIPSPPAPASLLGRRFGELEDPFTPLVELLERRHFT
jgi:uncharacterized protein (TIGR02996 family)